MMIKKNLTIEFGFFFKIICRLALRSSMVCFSKTKGEKLIQYQKKAIVFSMCYQSFCDFNFDKRTYYRFQLLLLCNFEILISKKKKPKKQQQTLQR